MPIPRCRPISTPRRHRSPSRQVAARRCSITGFHGTSEAQAIIEHRVPPTGEHDVAAIDAATRWPSVTGRCSGRFQRQCPWRPVTAPGCAACPTGCAPESRAVRVARPDPVRPKSARCCIACLASAPKPRSPGPSRQSTAGRAWPR